MVVLMSWTGRDEKKEGYYAFFTEVVLEFVAYAEAEGRALLRATEPRIPVK